MIEKQNYIIKVTHLKENSTETGAFHNTRRKTTHTKMGD